jgi:hypothetical protein
MTIARSSHATVARVAQASERELRRTTGDDAHKAKRDE